MSTTPQPDSPATAQPKTIPAPSFTPGHYRVGTPEGYNANIIYDADGAGIAQVYGLPMHTKVSDVGDRYADRLAIAHKLAASPSLYAYAKAEALFFAWMSAIGEDEYEAAQNAYMEHVVSLGWHEGSDAGGFLNKLRAAALAQAEGTTHV